MKDQNQFSQELMDIPSQIKSNQFLLLDLNQELDQISREIGNIESGLKLEISNAVDLETGKKLYSNDDARKSALVEHLSASAEYSDLKEKMDTLNRRINEIKIEIEYLSNHQRNIRAVFAFLETV
jgi:predicted  nucleic acid-binding Zn-ribbon protein